jgi:hypothetical protein
MDLVVFVLTFVTFVVVTPAYRSTRNGSSAVRYRS